MGLFYFGNKTISIIPGESEPTVHYSFMEAGDIVYYQPPGTSDRIIVTVDSFSRDRNGQPVEITVILPNGNFVTTTISNIIY